MCVSNQPPPPIGKTTFKKPSLIRVKIVIYSTPCKAEQLLKGMKLQEKEEETDEKHIGKLIRKNLKIKGTY